MSKPEIRYLLAKREKTMAEISREIGCTRAAVHGVLSGKWRSERLIEGVARALSITPEQLTALLDNPDLSVEQVEKVVNA